MRLLLLVATGACLGLAGLGHAKERAGMITCECRHDCWCKRPGLRLFRWVFPAGHRLG